MNELEEFFKLADSMGPIELDEALYSLCSRVYRRGVYDALNSSPLSDSTRLAVFALLVCKDDDREEHE